MVDLAFFFSNSSTTRNLPLGMDLIQLASLAVLELLYLHQKDVAYSFALLVLAFETGLPLQIQNPTI